MKNLFFILTMFFSLTLQAQQFSAGLSAIAHKADNVTSNDVTFVYSADLRYKADLGDGHHMLFYSEFSQNRVKTREGDFRTDGINVRTGFTMYVNAIPFDDLFSWNPDKIQLRALFGVGFEYDSYYQTGEFVPSVKLHLKSNRITFETGVQTHLIEAFYYTLVPEFRAGLYFDFYRFKKYR